MWTCYLGQKQLQLHKRMRSAPIGQVLMDIYLLAAQTALNAADGIIKRRIPAE